MKFTKNHIWGAAGAVLLIAIFIIFAIIFRPESPAINADNNATAENGEAVLNSASSTEMAATSTTGTPSQQNGTTYKKPAVKTSPGAVTQSYADALKEYSASGYRFQFVNCKATPGTLVIKKGATFMLDNRDNKAHKIKVGATTYSLGAYGFVIATAKTVGLNYIVCDGGGSARLQVEP